MVTHQPHRGSSTPSVWNHTGSANRGFVSLDPERQREVAGATGRVAPPRLTPNEFSFQVRSAGAKQTPPATGETGSKRGKGKAAEAREPSPVREGGSRR